MATINIEVGETTEKDFINQLIGSVDKFPINLNLSCGCEIVINEDDKITDTDQVVCEHGNKPLNF